MTEKTPAKRTYKELDDLLTILQFRGAESKDRSRTYWHERSDTIILLPASKPTQPIAESDLTSVQVRLVGRGLLEEDAFDEFMQTGALPAAGRHDG